MAGSDLIEVEGVVTDTLRGGVFIVETSLCGNVKCKPSGRMRVNKINIVLGDTVLIEVSPYDYSVGRIVRRLG